MNRILALALLLLPLTSQAACTLAVTNLVFANYASVQALDATENFVVSCDAMAGQMLNYMLAINSGSSASFVFRQMRYGPYSLNYNLYLDAAHTRVWGDGNTGTTVLTDAYLATTGVNVKSYTVYGSAPAGQAVPAGFYADFLVATLSY